MCQKATHCVKHLSKLDCLPSKASYLGGKPKIYSFGPNFSQMRQDLVLILYFFLLGTLVLLLGPSNLLANIRLVQIFRESAKNKYMQQKLNNCPPNWDNIKDECQHIPLN